MYVFLHVCFMMLDITPHYYYNREILFEWMGGCLLLFQAKTTKGILMKLYNYVAYTSE